MTAPIREKFYTLDVMRGVAAIMVVFFHFGHMLFGNAGARFGFESGYLAVDLFFMLSGFVIAYSYDRKLLAGLSFVQFAIMRYIRLLPMIWIGILFGSMNLWLITGWSMPHILVAGAANSLILPDPKPSQGVLFFANSTEWSLFFEIIANLAFAAAFPFLRLRVLVATMLVAAVGLVLCAHEYGRLQWGWTFQTFHVGLFRVAFSFCAGIVACHTRRRWQSGLPRAPAVLVVAALILLLLPRVPMALRPLYDLSFILVASPALILIGSVADHPGDHAAAEKLALLSYPLYAFHYPLLEISHEIVRRFAIAPALPALVSIAVAIPASPFLASRFDEPVRRWLTARLIGRPRHAAAPSPV